jgi:hypothetical protein
MFWIGSALNLVGWIRIQIRILGMRFYARKHDPQKKWKNLEISCFEVLDG